MPLQITLLLTGWSYADIDVIRYQQKITQANGNYNQKFGCTGRLCSMPITCNRIVVALNRTWNPLSASSQPFIHVVFISVRISLVNYIHSLTDKSSVTSEDGMFYKPIQPQPYHLHLFKERAIYLLLFSRNKDPHHDQMQLFSPRTVTLCLKCPLSYSNRDDVMLLNFLTRLYEGRKRPFMNRKFKSAKVKVSKTKKNDFWTSEKLKTFIISKIVKWRSSK